MCLDDTTLRSCISNITALWPHTDQPIRSIRMFKPWHPDWGGDDARRHAWGVLASFVRQNDASVLMGVDVTCNDTEDDVVWNWTLELMHVLGADHVMAVALGDEMELFFERPGISSACVEQLWGGGRYFDTLVRRAEEMDRTEAFRGIRLTSVFGAYSKAGSPFVDSPKSQVLTYLRKAWGKFGDRWVWSFTMHPFWDIMCSQSFASVPGGMADFRRRVSAVTGQKNDTMWMTETGWSSPPPEKFAEPCPGYCSLARLRTYYEAFMHWELGGAVEDGNTDHAFYFAMRDARDFGVMEGFGLVETCHNASCKLQSSQALVAF